MLNRRYNGKTGCSALLMREYNAILDEYSEDLTVSRGEDWEMLAEDLSDEYLPMIEEADAYVDGYVDYLFTECPDPINLEITFM